MNFNEYCGFMRLKIQTAIETNFSSIWLFTLSKIDILISASILIIKVWIFHFVESFSI